MNLNHKTIEPIIASLTATLIFIVCVIGFSFSKKTEGTTAIIAISTSLLLLWLVYKFNKSDLLINWIKNRKKPEEKPEKKEEPKKEG